ncbi:MAG: tetratricopeptide repeat protein [Candidatus Binatia bacterium]
MTVDDAAAAEIASVEPADRGAMTRAAKRVSYLVPGLVALVTFICFSPALRNDFVNWDDLETLVENENFRGFTWSRLGWMFTTFHLGHYQPLSWLTFSLDYLLWGMDPFGYHLTNILLHSANAVLFYFVASRLLEIASPRSNAVSLKLAAGLAALLFAIHPLRVESVAWATERRDVLSGLFLLLTVLSYLKAVAPETTGPKVRGWLAASVAFYVLSLLAKASGITLPLVLLVLDVYPLRRLGGAGKWFGAEARRVWLEKLPFFIAAGAAGAVALMAQQKAGALVSTETHDLAGRIVQALYGITFYLIKTLLPTNLAPLYEIPADLHLFHWRVIFAAIVFLVLSLGFFLARHRWPAGLAGWIIYLLLLAPVLGVAQAGLQLVADRYSYLSCMVWPILAASVVLKQRSTDEASSPARVALLIALPLFVLFGLGSLTWRQTEIWRDSETLWNHALAASPSSMAYFHVGRFTAQRGDLAEAEKYLRRAVAINPTNDVMHSNLALLLARQGNLAEATVHFHRALEINPADPATLNNMGIALAQQGKLDDAIQYFKRALEITPNDVSGHTNLANVMLARGELDGATEHLRRAIEIDPADAENQNSLAIVLAKRGNFAEAAQYLRRVVELRPGDAAATNNLAITLARQGQFGEAVQRFQEALRIEPNFAEAHAGLARVLAAQKKPEEAERHYQEALRILKAQKKAEASGDGKR